MTAILPPGRVLRVPLYAQGVRDRHGSRLFIWTDGKAVDAEAPPPSLWSTTPDGPVAEVRELRRLSDTSAPPVSWYRLAFASHKQMTDYYEDRVRDGFGSYVGDFDRWDIRILAEHPDFFNAFPHSRSLKLLVVDVEQRSEGGMFPAKDAPLVSIALSRGNGSPTVVTFADTGPDGEPDDGPVLRAWQRALQEYDPDIIIAFNAGYDMGVLAARGAAHGFPLENWGRAMPGGELAESRVVQRRTRFGRNEESVWIGGRVVWDVLKNASQDYSLSGVKDFKLKTIADFLGWRVIKEDTGETLRLWRSDRLKLGKYNRNDVEILERLAARYLADRVALAEFYGAPLGMCIDAPGGWGGNVASARALYAKGIVSDGMNYERHRAWLRRKAAEPGGGDDAEGSDEELGFIKPEGAYVALHRAGLVKPLFKADFASLYPNILVACGAGPDNTRIVGTDSGSRFESARVGSVLTLRIPDANYEHRWVIEVAGESAFTAMLKARMENRLEAKKAGDKARANILKTLLNAMFGTNGSLTNRYGAMGVSIICMGVGREAARLMEGVLNDAKVETDTDGIYTSRDPDVAALAAVVNEAALSWGLEPRFEVDRDSYAAGYFHEPKQYLLLDHEGKLHRVGAAMKGKAHPAVFDHIIESVGRKLLAEGHDAAAADARAALDLSRYDRRDFIQRVRLGQRIEAYAHESKEVKVARAHQQAYGTPPTPGRSYEYVRTKDGMAPPTPANLAALDEHAYLTRVILPALARLGFSEDELGVQRQVKRAKAKTKAEKRATGTASLASFI